MLQWLGFYKDWEWQWVGEYRSVNVIARITEICASSIEILGFYMLVGWDQVQLLEATENCNCKMQDIADS